MNTFKFVGKASVQVLKTAASFAAGAVVTFFLLYGCIALVVSERWLVISAGAVTFVVLPAAFAGCFYLTFRLLEPRMIARKKALVASLGIVLPLASFFSVRYLSQHADIPAPDVAEFFRWSRPPGPPKPYEEAIYDVYSDLFQQPPSLWDRLTSRPQYSGGFAIVDETIVLQDGSTLSPSTREEFQVRHYDRTFKLEKKFSLRNYVLITKTKEGQILRTDEECLAFQRNYPGYLEFIELSAVGFNKDQTGASVTIAQVDQHGELCGNNNGFMKYVELEKNRNGKWRVKKSESFAQFVSDRG
jgi:hypothetical protein